MWSSDRDIPAQACAVPRLTLVQAPLYPVLVPYSFLFHRNYARILIKHHFGSHRIVFDNICPEQPHVPNVNELLLEKKTKYSFLSFAISLIEVRFRG
jgi:hypothetical protein